MGKTRKNKKKREKENGKRKKEKGKKRKEKKKKRKKEKKSFCSLGRQQDRKYLGVSSCFDTGVSISFLL